MITCVVRPSLPYVLVRIAACCATTRAIPTLVLALCVVSVCPCVGHGRAKTVEPIEILFELWKADSHEPKIHMLDGVHVGAIWQIRWIDLQPRRCGLSLPSTQNLFTNQPVPQLCRNCVYGLRFGFSRLNVVLF